MSEPEKRPSRILMALIAIVVTICFVAPAAVMAATKWFGWTPPGWLQNVLNMMSQV